MVYETSFEGQGEIGVSSMDLYQLCKMYECEKCAGMDIPSYEGDAHKSYMYQCKDYEPPQYYWPSRCGDGFKECEYDDDEDGNCDGNFKGTLQPWTTSKKNLIMFR